MRPFPIQVTRATKPSRIKPQIPPITTTAKFQTIPLNCQILPVIQAKESTAAWKAYWKSGSKSKPKNEHRHEAMKQTARLVLTTHLEFSEKQHICLGGLFPQ